MKILSARIAGLRYLTMRQAPTFHRIKPSPGFIDLFETFKAWPPLQTTTVADLVLLIN